MREFHCILVMIKKNKVFICNTCINKVCKRHGLQRRHTIQLDRLFQYETNKDFSLCCNICRWHIQLTELDNICWLTVLSIRCQLFLIFENMYIYQQYVLNYKIWKLFYQVGYIATFQPRLMIHLNKKFIILMTSMWYYVRYKQER